MPPALGSKGLIVGKCHSGLWDAIISPSKTAGPVVLVSQRHTQFMMSPHCTPARPKLQFQDIELFYVMSCT